MAKNDENIGILVKAIFAWLFFPFVLIWKKTSWPNWMKWAATSVIVIFVVAIIGGGINSSTSVRSTNSATTSNVIAPSQTQTPSGAAQSIAPTENKAQPVQEDIKPTQTLDTEKQSVTEKATSTSTYTIPTACGEDYYKNSDGNCVRRPTTTTSSGATAQCRDGSYSFSQHRRGTCSGHGGVAIWF
jgi:hypothetical protein